MAKPENDRKPGYEARDVSVRPIALFGLALAALTALAFLLMLLLERSFEGRLAERASPPHAMVEGVPSEPPEPRLQVDAAADLEALRVEENKLLEAYGWVDAETARIPLERAMEMMVERGLPVRKEKEEKNKKK